MKHNLKKYSNTPKKERKKEKNKEYMSQILNKQQNDNRANLRVVSVNGNQKNPHTK